MLVYWLGYIAVISVYFYYQKIEDYRNSEKQTAVVIDLLWGNFGGGGKYPGNERQYPQFEFKYRDSLFISASRLMWVGNKEIGDSLRVIFPKGRPEEAIAYTFISYWIQLPVFLLSFFIALSLFMIPWLRRKYIALGKSNLSK